MVISMVFWKGKKVLITGGAGFIGSHLAGLLSVDGAKVIVTCTGNGERKAGENLSQLAGKVEIVRCDLRKEQDCMKVIEGTDVVFHLAAIVGGVKFNIEHPATMLRENSLMTSNVLEAMRKSSTERGVIMSSACVYPDNSERPMREEMGFEGEPDRAKFGYAWSKRFDELLAMSYKNEFGLKVGIARPFNVYGPRDVFDPVKSHVIPSIINQVKHGGKVRVYGSGEQERSFIFVKDLCESLLLLAEKHPNADPVNIGTRDSVKIIELAQKIAGLMGKKVSIEKDMKSNPGSMRRVCDTSKAEKLLGFRAKTSLDSGLMQTIEWLEKSGK